MLASSAIASAEPRGIKINAPRLQPRKPVGFAAAAPPSSRIIYVKRCPFTGCPVQFGPADDSRSDTSSIAEGTRLIGKFSHGDDVWNSMMQCVRETYAMFDVEVTDVDPGNVPHYEHLVGGRPQELNTEFGNNVGGVAPFACGEIPNAMTFTFDVWGPDADKICSVVAQETAHAFGLEHEMNDLDPLTYLNGPFPKRFQADDAPCGEDANRNCECGGTMQNSYLHIVDIFGPGPPSAPVVNILSPASGKVVQPFFKTKVEALDDTKVVLVELFIDGTKVGEATNPGGHPAFKIVAPDLPEGLHTLEARATDIQGTPGTSATIEIDLGPPCTAAAGCEGDDVCVMGGCVAGPDAPGGLGTFCQANTECLSEQCLVDTSGDRACVEPCDLSAGSCPSGFTCIPAGAGGVCWPNEDGGCCDTGSRSGSSPALWLLGLGVLVLVLRRRK